MSIIKSKYRGSVEYYHVFSELIRVAQYRGLTTYKDIAYILGLPSKGDHMGREITQILSEIAEDEVKAKRPMLTAVVVDSKGKMVTKFFELAKQLGRLKQGDYEKAFTKKERDAVYNTWKKL